MSINKENPQTPKSDWEELSDICYYYAQKHGLTKEMSREILKKVRETLPNDI